jgi:hypothetical protein
MRYLGITSARLPGPSDITVIIPEICVGLQSVFRNSQPLYRGYSGFVLTKPVDKVRMASYNWGKFYTLCCLIERPN